MATWKNHELNRVFKLINKILLFQYSKGIFSLHERTVTLKLAHKPELIELLLKKLKIENWLMSLLVTWKSLEKNWVFKFINKILLFQYSVGIFSVRKRITTLKRTHKSHLLNFFLTHYKLTGNSSISQRYKRLNIVTTEIGLWAFSNLDEPRAKPSVQSH